MDPNACMEELKWLLTERDPDREDIEQHLLDLLNWVKRGGFLPEWPSD